MQRSDPSFVRQIIDLEEEADARGYFVYPDDDDPDLEDLQSRRARPGPLPVSSRRR
jgi:hypothetical protein